MTTTTRGGVSRALAITALTGILLAAPIAAHAAPVTHDDAFGTGTYKSAGTGWDGVIDGRAAGTNVVTLGGVDVETFCTQYHVPGATSGTFSVQNWAEGFSGKAADIAVRHNFVPGKLADQRSENAAAQLAIWSFTDGVDFSAVPNAEIVARANQLVAGATEMAAVNGTYSVTTDVTTVLATSGAAQSTVTVKVLEADGDAAQGVDVTIDPATPVPGLESDPTGETNANGTVSFTMTAPLTSTLADVIVTVDAPAGTILAPEGDKQLVVTADDATVTFTAASIDLFVPLPAVTPTPEPTAAPAPTTPPAVTTAVASAPTATTAAKPSELPFTGATGTVAGFAGLLTVGALAAARFFQLRRRNS